MLILSAKKNILSWTSQKSSSSFANNTPSFNKVMHFKKSLQSPSSASNSCYQKLSKNGYAATFLTGTNVTTKSLWKNGKEPPSKKLCKRSSNPELLIGEILAITQKLKQTSETLSSSKTSSGSSISSGKLVGIGDAICNQSLKSTIKPIYSYNRKADVDVMLKDKPKVVNTTSSAVLPAIVTYRPSLDKEKNVQSRAVPNIYSVKKQSFLPFSNKNKQECVSSALASEKKMQNSCIQNYKLSCSLKKQLEINYRISNKPLKKLNSQFSSASTRSTAKVFCITDAKKKNSIKLSASKYQVVNKYSPFNKAITFKMSNKSSLNDVFTSQYKTHKWASEKAQKEFVSKPKYSKYKVLNKILDATTLKTSTPLKCSSGKNLKYSKLATLRKRKPSSGNEKNESQASKTRRVCMPLYVKPQLSISKSSTKLYSKTNRTLSSVKRNIKSAAKSKYKVIYEPSTSLKPTTQNRASKKFKVNSNKACNLFKSDIDVDLLLELAAEKKCKKCDIKKAPTPEKRVLIKRVFKSKNVIVNKNIYSAQVKTAKMIKSKYFAVNKKHSWQKQATSNRFLNNKRFRGESYKYFQNKNITQFYQKQRRSHFNLRNTHYFRTSNTLKRNSKRLLYHQNKYTLGSKHASKYFKRIASNHKLAKANAIKQSTPVSKVLASRMLQHSITRVLTASLKKKMSKVNTYCMFYNRFGRCNKGTKCPYIHDPSKIAICTRFLRGTCKVENCSFSHEICPGKMAICSFYLTGSCTKTDCPYRHEMLSPNSDLCKAFVKGYCPKGKQCKKAHVLVCPQYVQGFCHKGDECAFPHPPSKENKISTKSTEKIEPPCDSDEFLMEKVSRYFQSLSEEKSEASNNSVVPKRKNLPEQPSFISLSSSDS